MKKIIGLVMCLLLCVSVELPAMAVEDNDTIPVDEFVEIVKAEAALHGLECEVLSYDPTVSLTKKDLEQVLADLNSNALSGAVAVAGANGVQAHGVSPESESVSPLSMYETKNVYEYFSLSNECGLAGFQISANVTIDLQNNYVVSINSVNVKQSGASVNFVSWTTNSITKKTNSPSSGYITLTVTGTLTTEYTALGMTFGFSSDHTVTKEINCA